jgi:hypothetical protein
MPKWIIGIHGLANKSPKPTLRRWWYDSIREGLRLNQGMADPSFKFEMVYWADLLYKYPLHDDADYGFDKLYNGQPYYGASKSALKKYDDGWFDRVRAEATEIAGKGLEAVKETFGVSRLADSLLERVLKDLAYYWDPTKKIRDRDNRRHTVHKVLDDECSNALIKHRDDEIMLISHSMGTIISYNVLREIGKTDRGFNLPYYVTIGSPLGLSHVKHRTKEDRKEARSPSIVTERWVNLSDKRDPVAFDTHLRDDYGPNALGVRVVDDLVLNDYDYEKHQGHASKPNPHKSYGYLRTPEMSQIIAEFLAS